MKILLCGSEGSLGQALITELVKAGHEIVGVDNLMRHQKRPHRTKQRYVFYKGDLTSLYECTKINELHGPFDAVIQGAARIWGVGGFNADCANILIDDTRLNGNVLEIFGYVKRFVFISSSMVYERAVQSLKLPVKESQIDLNIAPAPNTEYGLSKYVNERMVIANEKQHGTPYTIWRPFNIITPYEKAEKEIGYSHVFADYLENILVRKVESLPIIGDGQQIRCFTWIDEVAYAIANFSFLPESKNDTFNIGNPEPIRMIDLAHMIVDIGHEKKMLTNNTLSYYTAKNYQNDVRVRVPDISKLQEKFNWRPRQTTEESVRMCIDYIRGANV
jgi:UDP-glucose 4-epimerase